MVKSADLKDAERVLDFYYNLIDDMRGTKYQPRWEKDVYPVLHDLSIAAQDGNLFFIEENDVILGAFILSQGQPQSYMNVPWHYDVDPERAAVLHLLATAAFAQGHGIGKKLLKEAVRIGRSRGEEVIRLDTLTWNIPGQKLYESFGFHCCGDVEMDYPTTGKIPFRMYEYRI